VSKLRDIMAYICENYPYPRELSKARLTKMVYLADWRSALRHGRQLSPIEWEFSHYGPYVRDVEDLAERDATFTVEHTTNAYGSPKAVIAVANSVDESSLTREERAVLDFVIRKTEPLHWDPFLKLVYSTFPVVTQERYSKFDLPALAATYHERKKVRALRRDD
jgi:hypothetical protein